MMFFLKIVMPVLLFLKKLLFCRLFQWFDFSGVFYLHNPDHNMKKLTHLLLILIAVQLTGCVTMLMPSKQKVIVSTGNPESAVYVNNEQIGTGSTFEVKVAKKGVQQVVVQTPNHKDAYYVLMPHSRPIAYYPMIVLDIPFILPLAIDPAQPKGFNYKTPLTLACNDEYVPRNEEQRYISLDAVKFDIVDKMKDVNYYSIMYSDNLKQAFAKAERERQLAIQKQEARDMKKKKGAKLVTDESKIKSDDSEYSVNVFTSLKKMGFVDTLSKVFMDNNNMLVLEGVIKKADIFNITRNSLFTYKKAKLTILWRIRNSYGEQLDSLEIVEYSGDFTYWGTSINKLLADAIDISYFNLMAQPVFLNHLKVPKDLSIKDETLTIPKPSKGVKEVADALEASVIVKKKDGSHGSGFAISNTGYVLTNFHVIAGDVPDKQDEIIVILSDGTELTAQIVRFNRHRDIALLKVDHEFPAAFEIPAEKSYKLHQEVYAAGAPKSIELGQSVSLGLISNERKMNNSTLLQLSISVNPGNSGGPLFEKSGAFHGVVTSKLVGYATEGVGFAIPGYLIPGYLNLDIR
jgi:hypothetical protein